MKNKLLTTLAVLFYASAIMLSTVHPSGGVNSTGYENGAVVRITWNDDLMTNAIDVSLWNGDTGESTILAQNLDISQGAYEWTIPAAQQPGGRYRFVITDVSNRRRLELSDGWITLGSAGPIISSVTEVDYGTDVHCDPFPASAVVRVSWADRIVTSLEVIDVMHRIVLTKDVDPNAGSVQVDISGIASGLAFVRLRGPNGSLVATPLMISH